MFARGFRRHFGDVMRYQVVRCRHILWLLVMGTVKCRAHFHTHAHVFFFLLSQMHLTCTHTHIFSAFSASSLTHTNAHTVRAINWLQGTLMGSCFSLPYPTHTHTHTHPERSSTSTKQGCDSVLVGQRSDLAPTSAAPSVEPDSSFRVCVYIHVTDDSGTEAVALLPQH